jgi:hypothetical protein
MGSGLMPGLTVLPSSPNSRCFFELFHAALLIIYRYIETQSRKTTEPKGILFRDDSNIGVVALKKKKREKWGKWHPDVGRFSPFSAVRWKFTLF